VHLEFALHCQTKYQQVFNPQYHLTNLGVCNTLLIMNHTTMKLMIANIHANCKCTCTQDKNTTKGMPKVVATSYIIVRTQHMHMNLLCSFRNRWIKALFIMSVELKAKQHHRSFNTKAPTQGRSIVNSKSSDLQKCKGITLNNPKGNL
jgi:hypothetical protein